MAEGINVRISGILREFVDSKVGENGLFESVSEYIRDLIRKDYEAEETKEWQWLVDELSPGMNADESEFTDFNVDELIAEAQQLRDSRAA